MKTKYRQIRLEVMANDLEADTKMMVMEAVGSRANNSIRSVAAAGIKKLIED